MDLDGASAHDTGSTSGCVPNHDGIMTSLELPRRAGLSATFKIATGATVDLVGTGSGSDRRWDLSGELPTDRDVVLGTTDVEGAWFASEFPDATYASKLASTEELLGVFQATEDGLFLLGVVSPDPGLTRTELHYDPPARILELPFEVSAAWNSTSTVSGVALGIITTYFESYSQRIDARGTLVTPYGEFPVLRVATRLERSVPAPAIVQQMGFFAECFGSVASVSSANGELAAEFTSAAEVRRLTR